jgi:hypothetical protein
MSQIFLSQGSQQGHCARRLHGTGSKGRLTGVSGWRFANQDARITTSPWATEGEEAVWHRCKSCAAEFRDLRIIQGDR